MADTQHIFKLLGSSMMIPLAICGTTGCRHKDIIDDIGNSMHPIVRVDYEWDNNELFRPDGLANLFYLSDSDQGNYWRSDFRPEGGNLRLPAGQYNVVAFNNDTENILFSGIDHLEQLTFSTPILDTSSIPEDQLPFPPQKLYTQPDRMWASLRKGVQVDNTLELQSLVLKPKRITREFHIEMTDIGNLESALHYYACLSDLTSSFKADEMMQTGPSVTMGNFMHPIGGSSLSSTITSFGVNKNSSEQHLAIYMWLSDGERKVYLYNVTDQIHEAPDSMNIQIKVKGPILPEIIPGEGESGGTGGMDVGVDNWDFIDIEL